MKIVCNGCGDRPSEYAEAIVKITQNNSPQNIETPVASGNFVPAGTIGLYTSPGLRVS